MGSPVLGHKPINRDWVNHGLISQPSTSVILPMPGPSPLAGLRALLPGSPSTPALNGGFSRNQCGTDQTQIFSFKKITKLPSSRRLLFRQLPLTDTSEPSWGKSCASSKMSARGERGPGRGRRGPSEERGRPRLSGAGRAGMGPWFSAGIRSGFGAGFVAGLPRRGREKPAGLWKGSVGADGASPAAVLSTELQLNCLWVWGGSCPSLGAHGDGDELQRGGRVWGRFLQEVGSIARWAFNAPAVKAEIIGGLRC